MSKVAFTMDREQAHALREGMFSEPGESFPVDEVDFFLKQLNSALDGNQVIEPISNVGPRQIFACSQCGNVRTLPKTNTLPYCVHNDGEYSWTPPQGKSNWTQMHPATVIIEGTEDE